ncbi:Acg family FMN-binding oxidoreductase [Mycolicibacterium frederiksbergense]|uniref:Acg family FMN-binding oxidoreductase n=1 Tax=Mycolicibacterium frederiksbergense TaxID=117567 RepID=UPI00265C1E04|nr:NAD(P)H nitroreductase [Mycolicibacterium frederiksbergense]MDO0977920.1 NAD(P)H nitroreductase [Mycolicibacterium frederiksbergense]
MTVHFPDIATIRTALSMATRAPSVHNSQPWQWRVGDRSVHLYADPGRRLLRTDPDGRDLLISCGASLHHATTAFAALGWQCKVSRLPNAAEPDHLAAIELTMGEPDEKDIALAAAIPRRRTDRRYFSHWPVPHADIVTIGVRLARMGVQLRHVETTIDIRAIVAEAVWLHANDAEYLAELTTWSGRYSSIAGVPARSTPESDSMAALPGRLFAGPALAQPRDATAEDDHGLLLALGTGDDDALGRLRAGEATSVALLTSTVLGLASCPVSEPLEIAETRAALRSEVFDDEAYPQMMLRIGWAPVGADPLPATARRPVDDVVHTLDGGPVT